MRGLRAAGLVAAAVLAAAPGCRRLPEPRVEVIEEEDPVLESEIDASEPRSELQFVTGFHAVEDRSWRWTKGSFAVLLAAPAGAGSKGATLVLDLTVPEVVIQRLKAVALSAKVNGVAVPPETYRRPGQYVYRRDVPAGAFRDAEVPVEFALDRFLAAGTLEGRELGIVVRRAGLLAK